MEMILGDVGEMWGYWIQRQWEDTRGSMEVLSRNALRQLAKNMGLTGKNSRQDIVAKRFMFWKWIRDQYGASTPIIGSITGHSHSVVLYGIQKVSVKGNWWEKNYGAEFREELKKWI